jgi:hypothetical protein
MAAHRAARYAAMRKRALMHILIMTLGGLIALAVFYLGARPFGWAPATGAVVFIWAWLAAALLNGAVGVLRAGIPIVNEAGAFILIFGVPAAAAWYLAYRHGR